MMYESVESNSKTKNATTINKLRTQYEYNQASFMQTCYVDIKQYNLNLSLKRFIIMAPLVPGLAPSCILTKNV